MTTMKRTHGFVVEEPLFYFGKLYMIANAMIPPGNIYEGADFNSRPCGWLDTTKPFVLLDAVVHKDPLPSGLDDLGLWDVKVCSPMGIGWMRYCLKAWFVLCAQ